jgi:hypothetical protein
VATALIVCLTACAAPWAFGAVEPGWWSLLAVGCLAPAALLLGVRALRGRRHDELPSGAELLAVCLPLLPLLTLAPLPGGVFALLSPSGRELLDALPAVDPEPAWRPLTLAPRATAHAAVLAGAYGAAFWVLARAALRPGAARVLTALLLAAGAALAGFGLLQRLVRYDPQAIYWSVPLDEYGTPFGPYVNRNHFGGAMCLVVGLAAGSALKAAAQRRKGVAALAGGALLLAFVALLATTSRGAILGFAAGALFLVWCGGRGARSRLLLGLAALAATGAVGMVLELSGRLFNVYGRWRNRFGVQYDAVTVFLDFPLFGTGPGGFEHVYPPFQTVWDVRHFSDAHSDWAQLLMDAGLAGVFLLAAVARHVVRRIGRALRGPGGTRWEVVGPAAGCVAVCVHGFFEVNLHVPANALLFTSTLSLAYAAAVRTTASGRAPGAAPGDAPSPSAGLS